MKPLFTKGTRGRLTTTTKSTAFPSNYGHQMMPLSGEENNVHRSGRFRNDKAAYSVNATANGGSEENIIAKENDGIGYEREFTVEESYIGSSRVISPPQP